MGSLGQFGDAVVIGSRAATVNGERQNVAFVWSKETGAIDMHPKAILPEESGFHEQSWFSSGTDDSGWLKCAESRLACCSVQN